MDGGRTTHRRHLRSGCATDARRTHFGRPCIVRPSHCPSAALPPHMRHVSVVCPPRSRCPSVIRPNEASSKRLRIVGVSSQCSQVVVFVAVAVVSISRSRRSIVACSSRRRRIVDALSSHRRRIVVASSSCCRCVVVTPSPDRCCIVAVLSSQRRRVVSFLAVKTPPLILETILHMSSELR